MPAIAGVCGPEFGPTEVALREMLGSLLRFGRDGVRTAGSDEVRFGAQLHHTLPEDDFDRQPYCLGGIRCWLVADARVDNRDELADQLGLNDEQLATMSDTELLARGWERWKRGLTDRLVGDFAFAAWDSEEAALTLVRGPLSSRPLFFARKGGSIAFASLPSAILATRSIDPVPNMEEFGRLLAGGLFLTSGESFFVGIEQLRQGSIMVFKGESRSEQWPWHWGPPRSGLAVADAGNLIRERLDQVATAQARRRCGPIACMLSAGRDSAAACTSLAQASGGDLIALTAAPAHPTEGLREPWIGDESIVAATTAAHANARHIVCRSEPANLPELLDEVAAVDLQPFNNPANLPWIRQLCETAGSEGAHVVVGGFAGNFTVSLGGPAFLPDQLREAGPRRWLGVARAMRRRGEMSWIQILARSFSWLAGPGIYSWLRRASGRSPVQDHSLSLLREPFRSRVEAIRHKRMRDRRAEKSGRAYYARLAQSIEPANRYALACWGTDIRDPTADSRLADLCLSLPPEAYVSEEHDRPAFHHAFKARLSKEVLEGRQIGAQAADWFATIRPDDVMQGFVRYSANPIVREMFDLDAIGRRIEQWPISSAAADAVHDEYCNQLLGGLAVASFINAHFPGQ